MIGSECGGLINIDKCTTELSYLSHARIQVKGDAGGFIKESIDILCWGNKITLKFFCLNDRRYRFHGVCNTIVYREDEKEDESDADLDDYSAIEEATKERKEDTATPTRADYFSSCDNSKISQQTEENLTLSSESSKEIVLHNSASKEISLGSKRLWRLKPFRQLGPIKDPAFNFMQYFFYNKDHFRAPLSAQPSLGLSIL